MRLLSRFSTAPALIVRVAVSLAAIVSFGAGLIAYVNGRVPAGENLPLAGALLVLVAAARRYCNPHCLPAVPSRINRTTSPSSAWRFVLFLE